MKITLVEDNVSLRKGITYRLEDDGYSVDILDDGQAALDFLAREASDLVILDINLPSMSGLDVLRAMRQRSDPRPVILLTARSRTEERVAGLDAGADDYLVKPFEMDELVARIRALARRRTVPPRRAVDLGRLRLELEPLRLTGPDGSIDMPRRELNVLAALVEARGTTVSKQQLLDRVYGVGSETDEKVIEVYISRLRKRLHDSGLRVSVQRGIGYTLDRDS